MSKEIREQLKQLRISQTVGKPLYKNTTTGKEWYLMGCQPVGRVYNGYDNYYLRDKDGKNLTVTDNKFEKFYRKV